MDTRTWILVVACLAAVVSGCSDSDSAAGRDTDAELSFADLRVEDIGASRAVVRFTTSRPTTCEAEYGGGPDTLDQVAVDPAMGPGAFALDHEVALEDLVPGTVYYYRARALDAAGQTFYSDVQQFTTATAPLVELVNFANLSEGATIIGVSSNFGGAGNGDTWGANLAIDGAMATEWATHGDGDDAWIELHLGIQRALTRFEFRSRRMPDGSSIITSVQLRFDGADLLGPFATPDPDVVYGFDFASPVSTRTVRVEAVTSTGGNTGAREIRLLGSGG